MDKVIKKIQTEIEKYIKAQGISFNEEIVFERSKELKFGDYSTNVSFRLAKLLHASPQTIAIGIKDWLLEKHLDILNIEIVGGYLNFFFTPEAYLRVLDSVKTGELFTFPKTNKRILIELVSANPTGLLHVGHGRGAAYGDSLARLLKLAGNTVTTEYYVNNAGNQIDNLAKSVLLRYRELNKEKVEFTDELYHGEEIIEVAKKLDPQKMKTLHETELIDYIKEFASELLLNEIKKDLLNFHVTFDNYFYETSLYKTGKVKEVLEKLKKTGDTYIEEGALFFKATKYGDEKDRVLVKSDGSYTYLLPDVAYHIDKLERNYDEVINVFGADHHGYMTRLVGAVKSLGYPGDRIKFEILQMVRILSDGVEIKQSKRSGLAVSLREIMEEVNSDALRFLYSEKALSSQMDLDLKKALEKTNENHVYYIQYAHARICSLLKQKNYDLKKVKPSVATVMEFREASLLVNDLHSLILEASKERAPYKLSSYLLSLANFIHSYYGSTRIITSDEEKSKERLYILNNLKEVLKKTLEILGVNALEEM